MNRRVWILLANVLVFTLLETVTVQAWDDLLEAGLRNFSILVLFAGMLAEHVLASILPEFVPNGEVTDIAKRLSALEEVERHRVPPPSMN